MSGVDDYENQYMGGGAILYQSKAKAPKVGRIPP